MSSDEAPAQVRKLLRRAKRDADHVIAQLLVPLELDDAELVARWKRAQRVLHDLRTYVWGTAQKKKNLAKLAADAEALDAIRGAAARGKGVTLSMLGVLALDGAPESVDALLPHLDPALAAADQRLDWLDKLSKLPITSPAVKEILREVDATRAARNARSPALALGPVIGIGEVDVLKLDARCFAGDAYDGGVQVDSTRASWLYVYVRRFKDVRGVSELQAQTETRNDRLGDNSLRLGRCRPEELPAYFARAERVLRCRFEWIPPMTNLRGKKRDRVMAWLRG